jgi:predicted DNA-binding protein
MELSEFYNNQISFRITDDIRQRLAENYEAIAGTKNKLGMREFFEKVIEKSIDSLIDSTQLNEVLQSNKNLIQENENLKIQLDTAKRKVLDFEFETSDFSNKETQFIEQINELNSTIDNLKNEISILQENEARKELNTLFVIKENEIVIEFTEPELEVITELCKNESKRTGKNITPQFILKNTFNDFMINGARDFFPRLPESRLKEIFSRFKKS